MNPLRAITTFCFGEGSGHSSANEENSAPLVSTLLEEEPGLAGLVEKFATRFREIMSDMERTTARSDWRALRDQAHNLKGLGAGCGYPIVSEVAAQLEAAAIRADASAVTAQLSKLRLLSLRIVSGLRAGTLPKGA